MDQNSIILYAGGQFPISPRDFKMAQELGHQQLCAFSWSDTRSELPGEDLDADDTVIAAQQNKRNESHSWPDSTLVFKETTIDFVSLQSQSSTRSNLRAIRPPSTLSHDDDFQNPRGSKARPMQQSKNSMVVEDLQNLSLGSSSGVVVHLPTVPLQTRGASDTRSTSLREYECEESAYLADAPTSAIRNAVSMSNELSIIPRKRHNMESGQTHRVSQPLEDVLKLLVAQHISHGEEACLPHVGTSRHGELVLTQIPTSRGSAHTATQGRYKNESGCGTSLTHLFPQKGSGHESDSEQEDPENGDSNDARPSDGGNTPDKLGRRMLACHFAKKASYLQGHSQECHGCTIAKLRNMASVRQHHKRKHLYCVTCHCYLYTQQGFDEHFPHGKYCRRCHQTFNTTDELRQHTSARKSCVRRDHRSEEEKWFVEWDFLFPQTVRPASPYADEETSVQRDIGLVEMLSALPLGCKQQIRSELEYHGIVSGDTTRQQLETLERALGPGSASMHMLTGEQGHAMNASASNDNMGFSSIATGEAALIPHVAVSQTGFHSGHAQMSLPSDPAQVRNHRANWSCQDQPQPYYHRPANMWTAPLVITPTLNTQVQPPTSQNTPHCFPPSNENPAQSVLPHVHQSRPPITARSNQAQGYTYHQSHRNSLYQPYLDPSQNPNSTWHQIPRSFDPTVQPFQPNLYTNVFDIQNAESFANDLNHTETFPFPNHEPDEHDVAIPSRTSSGGNHLHQRQRPAGSGPQNDPRSSRAKKGANGSGTR